MDEKEMAEQRGLIWITAAMHVYGHNREWFDQRIADGRLAKVGLPGSARVYLRHAQLKALGETPDPTPMLSICKAPACMELGRLCGNCGNYSCGEHGEMLHAQISAPTAGGGTLINTWICKDCLAGLIEGIKPFMPPSRSLL